MACVTGNGTTIDLTSQGILGRVVSIGAYSETGTAIEDSDLASTSMKYCVGDLVDAGTLSLQVVFDVTSKADWTALVVYLEDEAVLTLSDTSSLTGDCFVEARSLGPFENNERVLIDIELRWKAPATWAAAA